VKVQRFPIHSQTLKPYKLMDAQLHEHSRSGRPVGTGTAN
jgi:hypothetical protein